MPKGMVNTAGAFRGSTTAGRVDDGTAVNLGTMERTRVIDAVKEVMRYTGHTAEIELHPEMPTGPINRVSDNSLARELLGWEPWVGFTEGLHRTIDWYFAAKDRGEVRPDPKCANSCHCEEPSQATKQSHSARSVFIPFLSLRGAFSGDEAIPL